MKSLVFPPGSSYRNVDGKRVLVSDDAPRAVDVSQQPQEFSRVALYERPLALTPRLFQKPDESYVVAHEPTIDMLVESGEHPNLSVNQIDISVGTSAQASGPHFANVIELSPTDPNIAEDLVIPLDAIEPIAFMPSGLTLEEYLEAYDYLGGFPNPLTRLDMVIGALVDEFGDGEFFELGVANGGFVEETSAPVFAGLRIAAVDNGAGTPALEAQFAHLSGGFEEVRGSIQSDQNMTMRIKGGADVRFGLDDFSLSQTFGGGRTAEMFPKAWPILSGLVMGEPVYPYIRLSTMGNGNSPLVRLGDLAIQPSFSSRVVPGTSENGTIV